jgi:hypothetical protein
LKHGLKEWEIISKIDIKIFIDMVFLEDAYNNINKETINQHIKN